jgi:hypothetical protein
MTYTPCRDRRFTLKLSDVAMAAQMNYAFWLKHLVERLGAELVRRLWQEAFSSYDSDYTASVLASGWVPSETQEAERQFPGIGFIFGESAGIGDDALSLSDAETLIERTPPLPHLREQHADLSLERETSTFESLHLYMHGIALLAEVLLDELGKQGELIAYDILSAGRSGMARRMGGTVEDYIQQMEGSFEEPGVYSAGLEVETEIVSPREHITRVKECEWARYFLERHPRVGYLVACSTDEAFGRGFNESLRMQRTSTIMEGGSECDFHWYAVDSEDGSQDEGGAA